MVVSAYIKTINIPRESQSSSSEPSPQSRMGSAPFPEQHPNITGKGESREILGELQGVLAEVMLEEGISCLVQVPFHH